MVGLRVDELAHHPDFRIGFGAVGMIIAYVFPVPSAVTVEVNLCAIVNIQLLAGDARCMYELDLLGLAIAQCCGSLQAVEMIFIESLFRDRRNRRSR